MPIEHIPTTPHEGENYHGEQFIIIPAPANDPLAAMVVQYAEQHYPSSGPAAREWFATDWVEGWEKEPMNWHQELMAYLFRHGHAYTNRPRRIK